MFVDFAIAKADVDFWGLKTTAQTVITLKIPCFLNPQGRESKTDFTK